MKELNLFTGIALYVGASLDTKIGMFVFLLWLIAFGLAWLGWSLSFSLLSLTSSASYKYMEVESGVLLTSIILPWAFSLSLTIVLFSLLYRYSASLSSRVDSSFLGGYWGGGGGDGDC